MRFSSAVNYAGTLGVGQSVWSRWSRSQGRDAILRLPDAAPDPTTFVPGLRHLAAVVFLVRADAVQRKAASAVGVPVRFTGRWIPRYPAKRRGDAIEALPIRAVFSVVLLDEQAHAHKIHRRLMSRLHIQSE